MVKKGPHFIHLNHFLNTLYLKRSCNVVADKEKSPKWKVVGSKEFCLEGKILPL